MAGGGPALLTARPAAGPGPDPALAALAGLLGNATPPVRSESTLRQVTAQLSTMLASIGGRLGALVPDRPQPGVTAMLPITSTEAGVVDPGRPDPSLLLRQPPALPIGPILSLDPVTGAIVDPLDVSGIDDEEGDGRPRGEGALADPESRYPSSWLPLTGGLVTGVRRGLGSLADRIDALLAEVGMTRLQLLLLTLLGPAAVAFAIDVVAQIVAGR